MDEKVTLVFSWDPRKRAWIKERGPEDAAPPPAEPIDDEAVQTYFLDPTNGRWQATILGMRARMMAEELGDRYRSPYVGGLALTEAQRGDARHAVETEASPKRGGGRGPLVAVAAALLLLLGGGAFAMQAYLGSTSAADGQPRASRTASVPATGATAASPTAAPTPTPQSAAATQTATAASTTAATPRPATAAPTAQPTTAPTIVTLSVKTADGSLIFYRGPNILQQNTVVAVDFSVILPQGQRGNQTIVVYIGPIGATPPMSGTGDNEGRYTISIRATVPKGDQRLAVAYGNDPSIYTLGTLTVR